MGWLVASRKGQYLISSEFTCKYMQNLYLRNIPLHRNPSMNRQSLSQQEDFQKNCMLHGKENASFVSTLTNHPHLISTMTSKWLAKLKKIWRHCRYVSLDVNALCQLGGSFYRILRPVSDVSQWPGTSSQVKWPWLSHWPSLTIKCLTVVRGLLSF